MDTGSTIHGDLLVKLTPVSDPDYRDLAGGFVDLVTDAPVAYADPP